MNYIDLFAGAGGLSEGFVQNGFEPIAHIEMNKNAALTLKTRICYHYLKSNGEIEIYRDYLRGKITREELYASVPKDLLDTVINEEMSDDNIETLFDRVNELAENADIDVLVGGPPCQAYSLVGRAVKEDKMVGDPRNYLYKLYCKFLERFKPKMFVFENVPGLLTANKGQHFEDIKRTLKEVGYDIDYRELNAKDFGVLQNRKRIIIIGWQAGSEHSYPDFEKYEEKYTVNELLRDLPKIIPGETNNKYVAPSNKYLKESGIREKGDILTQNTARPNIDRDREIYRRAIVKWNTDHSRLKYTELPDELKTHKNQKSFLDRFKVVASDMPACHTMMAHISKDGHYFIHPDIDQARSITVREAARIQSFPDSYYFEGGRTAAFMQIGNAVPPLMAKAIAAKIKEQL